MNSLPRSAPLALLLLAAPLFAQTPESTPPKPIPAATPAANPAGTRVPPEIAPAPPPAGKEAAKPVEVTTTTENLSPGARPAPDPGKKSPGNLLDSLSGPDLDKILPLLKAHYLQPASLSEMDVRRAAVQGLLDRLDPKVSLVPVSAAGAPASSPFKSEILGDKTGYLRLGSIDDDNLAQIDAALKAFSEKRLSAVILDLRATPAGTNFDRAADVCRRFCPKGKILFTVRQPNAKDQIFTSKDEPLAHGILVALTDAATSGNGEIVAGVLRNLASAMVIGQKTKGEAAGFEDLPLSDSTALRVPVAEFVLPGDADPVAGGLKPDLEVEVSAEETKSVLRQELEKGVAPLVLEVERPRLNEAALVAGTNPDLDAMIAAQRNHGEAGKTALRDAALERALDFITSIAIYQKGARKDK